MDDGGLFFWLIIAAVAVLQGIGQKKKKAGQKPMGPARPRRAPPSRPDQTPAPSGPVEVSTLPGNDEAGSSETMIPTDVWAEILGLARGQPQQDEAETPAPVPTSYSSGEERDPENPREEKDRRPVPVPRTFPVSHGASVPLHDSSPADFESRLHVAESAQPRGEAGADGVRASLFGKGTQKELRRAVILKEVLSPPLALRDD